MSSCTLCSTLKSSETSWSKVGCPEDDRPLPPAAARLTVLPLPDGTPVEKRHVRRCPECGAFFGYLQWHEYSINGTEDEEELTRLPPAEIKAFCVAHARGLEQERAGLDALRGRSGSLGDYIDRGHPDDDERQEALAEMSTCDAQFRAELPAFLERIDLLRSACPEILDLWIGVHLRVCGSYLDKKPARGPDADLARHLAADTRDCWESLRCGTALLIRDPEQWLPDYPQRVAEALAAL